MNNVAASPSNSEVLEDMKKELLNYMTERHDPRVEGTADIFNNAVYLLSRVSIPGVSFSDNGKNFHRHPKDSLLQECDERIPGDQELCGQRSLWRKIKRLNMKLNHVKMGLAGTVMLAGEPDGMQSSARKNLKSRMMQRNPISSCSLPTIMILVTGDLAADQSSRPISINLSLTE